MTPPKPEKPKFHAGGIVRASKPLVVLRAGERVFTREQMKRWRKQ